MNCISQKKTYSSASQAEDALIDAQIRYDYTSGNGPVAIYKCVDCGQYHLTSKGPVNERLAKLIEQGKVKSQKEANRWIDKLGRSK
jgi:hypothetical protein